MNAVARMPVTVESPLFTSASRMGVMTLWVSPMPFFGRMMSVETPA